MKRISIIGGGNMGRAIARGLAQADFDCRIAVSTPHPERLRLSPSDSSRIEVFNDNIKAAADADVVILCVKPWILPAVAAEIKEHLSDTTAVVSIAGGVGLDALAEMLNPCDGGAPLRQNLFHVIPDTAISVGAGMTFISCREATTPNKALVLKIFSSMGDAVEIEEKLMGAATALSSCGIAYVYKFIQAYVQAGVEMGFRPADAQRYTLATVSGAVALLSASADTSPQSEIDRVTTPGGMTIKGINTLEHEGFTSAVIKAILAPLKK